MEFKKFLTKTYPLFLLCFPIMEVFASPFEYGFNNGFKYVIHKHNEDSYQNVWCAEHKGIMEFQNKDFTRVDCLTDTHAVEFDFANKWAESVGQALHYGLMTNKIPKVVLIIENEEQKIYFKRVERLGKIYHFEVEYITDKILKIDKYGHCSNPKCKCQRNKKSQGKNLFE